MTPEDEAFDELARKQGSWGGGFQAKRAMAADKLQEPKREALKLALEALEEARTNDDSCEKWDRNKEAITAIREALAQPAQEPVARVSGTYGGKFVYDPINRATILPVGMALYSSPQGNT